MTQSRHSGTPVHLASSSHPPIALVSASLSSPPAPRGSGEAALAGSALGKEAFPPSTLQPRPRAECGMESSSIPFGVSAPCQPPMEWAPLPLLHPCGGTAKDGSQDAPQGRGPPPLPGGHLRPGSSPSSAFPGGFRLPLFLRLPGTRTFVPARPRLPAPGVPPPPAGGRAGMKPRGLPRHPRRAAGAKEPAPVPPPPPRTPQTSIFSSN